MCVGGGDLRPLAIDHNPDVQMWPVNSSPSTVTRDSTSAESSTRMATLTRATDMHDSLPDDCWAEVASFLTARSMCRCACVSARFGAFASSPAWRELFVRTFPQYAAFVDQSASPALGHAFIHAGLRVRLGWGRLFRREMRGEASIEVISLTGRRFPVVVALNDSERATSHTIRAAQLAAEGFVLDEYALEDTATGIARPFGSHLVHPSMVTGAIRMAVSSSFLSSRAGGRSWVPWWPPRPHFPRAINGINIHTTAVVVGGAGAAGAAGGAGGGGGAGGVGQAEGDAVEGEGMARPQVHRGRWSGGVGGRGGPAGHGFTGSGDGGGDTAVWLKHVAGATAHEWTPRRQGEHPVHPRGADGSRSRRAAAGDQREGLEGLERLEGLEGWEEREGGEIVANEVLVPLSLVLEGRTFRQVLLPSGEEGLCGPADTMRPGGAFTTYPAAAEGARGADWAGKDGVLPALDGAREAWKTWDDQAGCLESIEEAVGRTQEGWIGRKEACYQLLSSGATKILLDEALACESSALPARSARGLEGRAERAERAELAADTLIRLLGQSRVLLRAECGSRGWKIGKRAATSKDGGGGGRGRDGGGSAGMIRPRRKAVEVGAGEEGKEETRGQEGKGTLSTWAQGSGWGARGGRGSFQVHPLLLLCLSGCPPFASPSSSGSLLGWRVRIKAGVALGQDVASALSRRRFLSNAFSRGCLTCGSIAVVSRVVYRLVALLRTRWSAAAVRGRERCTRTPMGE